MPKEHPFCIKSNHVLSFLRCTIPPLGNGCRLFLSRKNWKDIKLFSSKKLLPEELFKMGLDFKKKKTTRRSPNTKVIMHNGRCCKTVKETIQITFVPFIFMTSATHLHHMVPCRCHSWHSRLGMFQIQLFDGKLCFPWPWKIRFCLLGHVAIIGTFYLRCGTAGEC